MPVVVYIGEQLRNVRTRRLLTQDELADKAGVSQSTIANIERNNAEPHFRTIRKLAKALDVDPSELLGEWPCQRATESPSVRMACTWPATPSILRTAPNGRQSAAGSTRRPRRSWPKQRATRPKESTSTTRTWPSPST